MLTVNLHLCNGDVITLNMTPSQRNRLSRTLNQAVLPPTPFIASAGESELAIPWRSIGYISASPQLNSERQADQAAD